jgi:hypothetical protein
VTTPTKSAKLASLTTLWAASGLVYLTQRYEYSTYVDGGKHTHNIPLIANQNSLQKKVILRSVRDTDHGQPDCLLRQLPNL